MLSSSSSSLKHISKKTYFFFLKFIFKSYPLNIRMIKIQDDDDDNDL